MGVGLLLYSEMCFPHTHFPSDICFPVSQEFPLAVTIFKAYMICRIMIVTELRVKACLCFIQASQEWKRTHMQSCICIFCYFKIISTMKYLISLYHTSPMQKWLSRDVTKQYHLRVLWHLSIPHFPFLLLELPVWPMQDESGDVCIVWKFPIFVRRLQVDTGNLSVILV